jgi:hypothetical protein
MRRRSVLAAGAACLATIAGCTADREPAAGSPTTDPGESPPPDIDSRDAFRAAVERQAARVETISLEGTNWTVTYSVDACCGDPFEAHQAALARNFSAVRPANVSLNAMAFHECMNVHWRIPAALARKDRTGEMDTATYVNRVRNTTSRESQC